MISADKRVLPPMAIMLGQVFKDQLFYNGSESDTLLAISETNFINDELALDYLKHFNNHTDKAKHLESKRLLVMEVRRSHATYEFRHTIRMRASFRPGFHYDIHNHCSRLKVKVFERYKHCHEDYLAEEVNLGGADFSNADFLAMLPRMGVHNVKRRVILSSWEKAGILSFNPEIVL